ncbi:MAG: hypothetical protein OXB92_07920 [Acidimicrobiaceae bacterium]|nr:hypothetical protein [Acidimicrobiia bacterium]MCY4493765.1 hypothetical protein [Acidimicrobiaceae bacterium]
MDPTAAVVSIAGRLPGTEDTVRVSARNPANSTPLRDSEGRARWIESTVTNPAN